jgi:MFS family permease
VLLAVALAGGTCGPALTGALTSQLATVVPERHIGRAFGLDSLTYTLASLAGPTIAALLVTGTTPTAGMLALSTIALCAAATLALLPSQAALASEHPPNLLATARVIGRDRVLGVTVWTAAVAQIGLGTLPVVAVTIAQQHHPALAGVLLSGIAAGAVAGSLLWTWRPARGHRVALAGIGGLIGTGAPLAVAAVIAAIAVPIEPVAIGCLFALSGLATGYGSAAVFVIRHELSPPGTRSQVFTLASGIKITGAAAGTAIAGLVATTPLTLQLALAAAPPLLAGAAGLLIVRTRSTPPPDRRHRPSI